MAGEQPGNEGGRGAVGTGGSDDGGRLALLDLMRSVALLRVIVFHVTGVDALSLIASMPVMFFVAGALYARSISRRPGRVVVKDRFRRILPSLFIYASVLTVGYGASGLLVGRWADIAGPDGTVARLGVYHTLALFVPVISGGSPVGPGLPSEPVYWTWNPLWYVHTHLVLALLGVPLWALYRRWPVWTLRGLAVWWVLVSAASGGYGNIPTFAVFFVLGFAFADGRLLRLSDRVTGWTAIGAGILGLAFLPLGGVGLGVNQWAPSLLAIGVAWVAISLRFRDPLERFAAGRAVRPVIGFLNRRALSIYLWHMAGIFVSRLVLPVEGDLLHLAWIAIASLGLTVAVTLLGCLVFGWVEDLAARRRPEFWPSGLVEPTSAR